MKFLVSIITTLVLVFAMNLFHEDYFKDASNFFEEINYKNSTEVFKIDQKIGNFFEVLQERRRNRTRSLNEIECTKTFYKYIKDDPGYLFYLLDYVMKNNTEVKKLLRKFPIEMKTKSKRFQLKPYLRKRTKMAFREKTLCVYSSMKIKFTTKTHTGILAFLSSRQIGQIMDDWIIDDSQKLLRLELRLTRIWQDFKYAITYSPYPIIPHHESQKHKLDVEIRFALRNTKEDKTDDSLKITKDEQNWKLRGKGFLNTLYVLIIILMCKIRFNVIIDFNCHHYSLVRFRFQIILMRLMHR